MSNTTDYRKELTDNIINLLEKGTVPWQQDWQPSDNRLFNRPYNPHSAKPYRGMNSLSLMIQSMEKSRQDPRWCTYKQAEDNGWQVNKGEKGTLIEYWRFDEKVEKINAAGETVIVTEKLERPQVFRAVVFNVEQMSGVPPLEKGAPHEWQPAQRAEAILKNSGAVIEHKTDITPHYAPGTDKIVLPERHQFKNAESYYATVLHELGHWTGDSKRLDRDMTGMFGTPNYAKEELRAELASFFTAGDIGIINEIENHASYLSEWIKVLKEDKNEIFRAAGEAEKIADYLLGFEKVKTLNQEKTVNKEFEHVAVKHKLPDFAKTDIRLMVDYAQRQEAKELGAKWDKDLKIWYAPKGEELAKFKPFMGEKVVNLRDTPVFVNYEERDEIKALGALWNPEKKEWFIPAGCDIKNLPKKFFKDDEKQIPAADNKPTFAEFAKENGLLIEGEPVPDGKFHRVPVDGGKLRAKDGSYVYYDDAAGKAGWIKNFKTGFEASYGETKERSLEIKRLSADEIAAREAERRAGYDIVAKKADYLISQVFQKAENHPYLEAKKIKPHGSLIDKEGALIIPLTDSDGQVRTFQRIEPDGTKSYIKGGEKSGAYYNFGSPKDRMLICEGFATGASIYEATRIPTICAMDTGNLKRVAEDMRTKYGERMLIVIAADNDHATKDNPGLTFAQKAAGAVNGAVVYPNFNDTEKASKLTDFNDLATSRGLNEVKKQIYEQKKELEIKNREMEK